MGAAVAALVVPKEEAVVVAAEEAAAEAAEVVEEVAAESDGMDRSTRSSAPLLKVKVGDARIPATKKVIVSPSAPPSIGAVDGSSAHTWKFNDDP